MYVPSKSDARFVAQLRKSLDAFRARQNDFEGYPINVEEYSQVVDEFSSAIADETKFETQTVAEYQDAREECNRVCAEARAKRDAIKAKHDKEKARVRETKKLVREKAENFFHRYQNIAEAVYLGSDRDHTIPEFEVAVKSTKRTASVKA